ncbi:Hypothetical protein FKW44_020896 [Caligus rogercresseyi]|uniref:Uncharacterized protein n=1 Tax=Caligus rogercresseyi TaxID=217165 RepID=A0A7T8GQL3_CALRO|nr:Hypothetical protein FKW44_020896 [Caligus rogercresseyi]
MKISDPLGKVYTHTMFNKKSKLSRGKKRSSNSSSGGVKAIGGGGRSSYSQSVMAEPERDTFHHRIHGNRDSDSQEEGERRRKKRKQSRRKDP